MTLDELAKVVKEYTTQGFYKDVAAATRQAQIATRDFVARTHPHTAFGGKTLDNRQFVRGSYKIVGSGDIHANIYANYFARWYNTGAFGRIIRGSGPRKGQHGPSYPPRGNYFGSNKSAIEEYFAQQVDEYLKTHIKL